MEEGFEPGGTPGALKDSLLAIPGYSVTEELARGGMGIVYRARQHAPSRVVALKMLLPFSGASSGVRERFQQEARTLSELDHPAILPIYETGEHGHLPWFSMKLATGGSLAERIGSFAGAWKEIAELMIRVADAVQYAHDHGVLHRDLKPGNLLFDGDGRVFVADFGLAKLIRPGSDLTQSHRALGTPHYLAPEVAATHAGRATTASDVYSLGAILFELLAGRPPFEAEGIPALLRRIVEEEPAFPTLHAKVGGPGAAVPRDLAVMTLRCLAKDPARRYPSPRELAEELRRYLAGEPILARPLGSTHRMLRWCRRQPALASAIAGVALLLVSLTVVFAMSSRRIERLRLESLAQLYAADMRLAQQALAERKFGPAAELLERHQPRPGDPDLRGFEWWHLQDRCRSEESASLGTVAGPAQRLAYSSDGHWVAAAGTDLLVWDARDRRIVFRKPVGDFVWALAFSPDSSLLYLGMEEGSIRRCSMERDGPLETVLARLGSRPLAIACSTSTVPLRIVCVRGWAEWDGRSPGVVWQTNTAGAFGRARVSQDGFHVAALRGVHTAEVWSLEPAGRTVLLPLPGMTRAMDISPDGDTVALAEYSGTLRLVESRGVGKSRTVAAHRGIIECAVFSPDGLRIATAGIDQTVRVHEVATGERVGEWQGHRATILSLAFSPDGRWLVSGDKSGETKLWDTAAPPPRPEPARNLGAMVSLDGGTVLTRTNPTSVTICRVTERIEPGQSIPVPGDWVVVPVQGRLLAIEPAGRMHRFEAGVGWRVVPLGGLSVVNGTVASSDGRWIALRAAGVAGFVVWDAASGREVFRTGDDRNRLNPTFSPDGTQLACGSIDGVVQVWQVPSGRVLASIPAHRNMAYDCDFSRDGRRLATAGFDGWVRLWEVETGRLVGEYRSTGDAYWTIALSPDGTRIAAGTSESGIVLWDVESRTEVAAFQLPGTIAPVEGRLRFTPDGRTLVRANGVLNLWTAPGLDRSR